MRFLCDEMLRGVGRSLRVAGYDTLIAPSGTEDADLLALATHQSIHRLALTPDGAPPRAVPTQMRRTAAAKAVVKGMGTATAEQPAACPGYHPAYHRQRAAAPSGTSAALPLTPMPAAVAACAPAFLAGAALSAGFAAKRHSLPAINMAFPRL